MKISTILDQIDLGAVALPEFQRGYVWNRDQVRALVDSMYRRHPVGSLLVWETRTENADARGDGSLQAGHVKLLLDGQQRITSLYGIIRGKKPPFFEGNEKAFKDLYFNLEEESFEFYGPVKMKDNPFWISVTELFLSGSGKLIKEIVRNPDAADRLDVYFTRLNALDGIKDIDLHIDEVTGSDKTVDVVVDIFNKVNSGGTKLSKGDLALAKICAQWPHARDEMNERLDKWKKAGFNFKLDWFLRCINTTLTGEAKFTALSEVTTAEFREALVSAEKHVNWTLDLIASRLGLDHNRVLGSRYSIPAICRLLENNGGPLRDHKEQERLLYWYIHSLLWGRYAGSTESKLDQDLDAIESGGDVIQGLVDRLRVERGDLRLTEADFGGWSRGARFYPMMYMMTRVCGAVDWGSGNPLSAHLLGYLTTLQIHHIFPKAFLYQHDYARREVNALANFTFLTQDTNLKISDREPAEYFVAVEGEHPDALATHWIPMDERLWLPENYLDFLAARRELLAEAANNFLDRLWAGTADRPEATGSVLDRERPVILGSIESEDEEEALQDVNSWIVGEGLPEGELAYEVELGPDAIAVLDLAWPDGLQPGLSRPVALLLDESGETLEAVAKAGFDYYDDVDDFKDYVRAEILARPVAPEPEELPAIESEVEVPEHARKLFYTMLEKPAPKTEQLRYQVRGYVALVKAEARQREFVDVPLAEHIGQTYLELLDWLDRPDVDDAYVRIVAAGIHYFCSHEDAIPDYDIGGFDDDADVLNAVAMHLGRKDLTIPLHTS